jgi:oligosaccharide repeat unit polymerase
MKAARFQTPDSPRSSNMLSKPHAASRWKGLSLRIFFQIILVFSWVVAEIAILQDALRPEKMLLPCVSALVFTSVWCITSWYCRQNNRSSPYGIFLIVCVLFNAGSALAVCLQPGRIDAIFPIFNFTPATLFRTYGFVGLGLSCFHLGALFYVLRNESRTRAIRQTPQLRSDKALLLVGLTMILISMPAWLALTMPRIQRVILYGYGVGQFEMNERTTGIGSAPGILAGFFVPGVLFLLAGSGKRKIAVRSSLALVLIYAMLGFLSGSRGPASIALISYGWAWHVLMRPIVWTRVILAAALAILLLPLISATRELPWEERRSIKGIIEAYTEIGNPVVSLFDETGWSATTIAHTIELVPQVRPYDMGLSYAYAAINLLPNVFGGEHPINQRGFLSDWLVLTVSPDYAMRGGGWGFSFIAEAYLNFGVIGGAAMLSIIGWLICWLLSSKSRFTSPAEVALVGCLLAAILMFARGESAPTVRSIVWYGFIPYWAHKIVSRRLWESGRAKRSEW